jgi:anaerobic selenocysteine-containing dehydrogenase
MHVLVENGKLRMIEALPGNRATSEGICLKGLSYLERVYAKDRILTPLRRNPGSRNFQPVSWDVAYELILENILRLKQKYGPKSILYYFASGTKGILNRVGIQFWQLFGGCTSIYGDLCWPAGLEATRLMLGENSHNAPWDIARARLIILWGKNPAETNIHQVPFIEKALSGGARLVVIDPRRTQSAEQADLLIQPRPGTDGIIALALANALIKSAAIDQLFVQNHVLGYEAFADHVKTFSLERAAGESGVPLESLRILVRYFAEIKPVTINAGYGMQRYRNSGQTIRAIIALLAITGNIGKPGAGWIFANLQSHLFDAVKDPLALYPPERQDDRIRISVSTARLGPDILNNTDPPVKMIWVERGNPVTQNPETHTVIKAFRSVDFRVTIDQFMTDTACESDLILPAKTMFEQTDVINAYWHSYIQIKQKVIDPPGAVKPESEIYYDLARLLGFSTEELKDLIPGPSDAEIEKYLEKHLRNYPGLTLARLREGPVPAPGSREIAFEDLIFRTPSGKIELLSNEARVRWQVAALPDYSFTPMSAAGDGRFPLYLMTPNTKNRIHSQFNNLQLIRQFSEKPIVAMHPEDAQKRDLVDGDLVRVFNERGELRLPLQLDFGLRPGCVVITNGWWISQGGTVNFLSQALETDMGHGAAFHETMVEVESAR